MQPNNYYNLLEVSSTATFLQIKASFHKLALKYHPDKNSSENATEKFREILEAYSVLSNIERRRYYDQN